MKFKRTSTSPKSSQGTMGRLFTPEINEEVDGMKMEALRRSRENRRKFFKRYNLSSMPQSILVNDPKDKAIDMMADDRSCVKISFEYVDKRGIRQRGLRNAFKTQKSGARKGTLSRFPQNVGRILVNFYCPPDGIVIDLFAGHNSRMQLVHECGRHYIGFDVSRNFMEANRKIRDILLKRDDNSLIGKHAKIELYERSSDDTGLPDEYGDFSITSPPYFKLEDYGDEPEQLGKSMTYEDFLVKLKRHAAENFRVLKWGAYCIWCINDFYWDAEYRPFHIDVVNMLTDSRFRLHDILIVDLTTTIQTSWAQRVHEWKTFPKRHEYAVILQKSKSKKRVVDYTDKL